ncbi:cell division protein FtsX [Taylorella equigenitalis]|uniref:cell division protein FtsX n=1 Tax=Taylorella equigenitalis TaxID=29575 RepID=UPI000402B1ED|nr:ABC transporter permease [Taylorella equigenitalis]ASY29956.1 ABC transporter permease [Taylorella equigenitalis]KOS59004.1 permease [Taylorella equigenitalis]
MKSWIRHYGYALNTAFRRLAQMPASSILNIIVIAFVLSIPIVLSSIVTTLEPATKRVSVNPVITVFMKDSISLEDTKAFDQKLKNQYADSIASTEVVSKEEAYSSLRQEPEWADSLKTLDQNPLPHSIIVTLKDSVSSEQAKSIAEAVNREDAVDLLQFDSDWIKKLQSLLNFLRALLGILALGVIIVVVSTVFNTIRMQALIQRDEIAVARLVGATESFVRRPFRMFGAITGFFACLLAILFAKIALVSLNGALGEFASTYGLAYSLELPNVFYLVISILVVMFVASLSAAWSVTRTTKF